MLSSAGMSEDRNAGSARLERLLSEVGTTLRRGTALELAIGALAVVLLALALGAALALSGLPERTAALFALGLLAAGLLGLFAFVGWRIYHIADGPLAVARWLDGVAARRGRATAVALLDAAEIRRDLGRFGESERLGIAAIDRAAQAAEAGQLRELTRAEGNARARAGAAVVLALLAVNGLLALIDRGAFASVLFALTTREGLEAVLVPRPPEPRLGDIRVDYRYPEYTGRPPRTVVSPTGKIRALPGTEVTVETRSRTDVREAVMVLQDGAVGVAGDASSPLEEDRQNQRRIAVEVDGRRMRVRFVVSRAGRYRFLLVDAAGNRLEERRGHDIDLELDDPPRVRLLQPEESPLEVNARDRLPLVFEATDDFGLGAAQVAWRVLGTTREGKLPLTEASAGKRRFAGRARFNLRRLSLKPGDRVAYSVEVFDNDSILGPKVGASETKELRVYSKKAHHERVMQKEMAALDALVHLLGDHLETPYRAVSTAETYEGLLNTVSSMSSKAEEAVGLLEQAASAIREDPLGRENVGDAFLQAASEVQRRLGSLRRAHRIAAIAFRRDRDPSPTSLRALAQDQARMISTLERQAVYLSDLIDDQRMIDAEALAKDLREQQTALREALEDYKAAPTEEKRAAIARAIQDIQRRIEEIMSELAKLRHEIPQDFVNAEALQDRTEGLDRLRQQIEEGDLDGAMRSLDRMLNQTERMLSQLQEGREELQSREYSEITERAERLWNELSDVQARQRDLAERTESIANAVRERSQARLGDASQFVEEQLRRLDRAKAALEEVRPERHMPDAELFELTERRIADGRQALEAKDFGAAREVLERSLEQMKELDRDARRRADQAERFGDVFGMGERARETRRALGEAEPQVEAVIGAIEKLAPSPGELSTPEERRQLERFEKEQDALSKRAEDIQKGLEDLGEQLPIVGPEVRSALDEARSAMGESKDMLGRGDAPGALAQERRAVEALERLSEQLEEMGSQSGGGQGGAGVPLPFGQPKGSDRENERGGNSRFNRDRVEIPKPEAYQAPSEFREDILEAAKQGTVESYRDAVRRYYEELVK